MIAGGTAVLSVADVAVLSVFGRCFSLVAFVVACVRPALRSVFLYDT